MQNRNKSEFTSTHVSHEAPIVVFVTNKSFGIAFLTGPLRIPMLSLSALRSQRWLPSPGPQHPRLHKAVRGVTEEGGGFEKRKVSFVQH